MKIPCPTARPFPRQFTLMFDPEMLQGLTPSERGLTIMRLAALLTEAAGLATEESHDED